MCRSSNTAFLNFLFLSSLMQVFESWLLKLLFTLCKMKENSGVIPICLNTKMCKKATTTQVPLTRFFLHLLQFAHEDWKVTLRLFCDDWIWTITERLEIHAHLNTGFRLVNIHIKKGRTITNYNNALGQQ